MPVVPTTLTITPSSDGSKRLVCRGRVAVNERVAVTVAGVIADGAVPAGLVLRLTSLCGRTEYARFPSETGDAWAVSGADATCTLSLATRTLQHVFLQRCEDDLVEVSVKLESAVADNLYGKGRQLIENWIQNPVSPVAGGALLQAQIDVLAGRLSGHQHDGGEGSETFPHNNLTGRDAVGAHPAIEQGVADLGVAVALAQSAANTAGSNAAAALVTAEAAKVVTDAIRDGDTFTLVTSASKQSEVRALINQIAIWLNARRNPT